MKAPDIKRRFIDKFFSERELIVEFDETSDSDKKNAQAWYKAVEKTVSTLPIYQHDNVGQPLDSTGSNVWFFRGQKDSSFAFTSTLYRRLLDASSDKLYLKTPGEVEEAMLQAELSLLDKARKIGIGRGLTALETLTLLQHHGSPTRLIDVTSDWKVALFFACESDDDRDGRLFLIKTDPCRWKKFPKDENAAERRNFPIWKDYHTHFPYVEELSDKWLAGTWPILLPFSDPRMISQRGFFLVGGVPLLHGAISLKINAHPGSLSEAYAHPDSETYPRAQTIYDEKYAQTKPNLPAAARRDVTSMPIRFGRDLKFFKQIATAKRNDWSAVGYSIRVPKRFKRTLRDILRRKDVHKDSIYPPLRETVRLFEHVVDESFKE
nr:FRG domain-containing protein [Schaalia odontolytica]